MEKVGAKNAIDVFCGNQHSFYINDKNQLFAWGLNNHGQLGIGNKFNQSAPTRVKDLDPYEGDYVVEVSGGEHHSIGRTKKGLVYCWGRNDEGQCGVGDTYGDWRKKKAAEKAAETEQPPVATQDGAAKKKETPKKEEDLKYIFYFYRPELVESLWKWELKEGDDANALRKPAKQIIAAGQYSYAICEDAVYSWGMGENYVLGNRDDENEFKPYKVDPRMFENNQALMMACGTMHCVALTSAGDAQSLPAVNGQAKVL